MLNVILTLIMDMILFGAGSSTPFDVPGMEGFTKQFIAENKDLSELTSSIEDAIKKSGKIIGFPLSFDLETLLAVLNDLSDMTDEKPISIPTASLLLKETLDIEMARKKYHDKAQPTLRKLREFIFKACMQPIESGKKEGNFQALDLFYGPLMTLLNRMSVQSIQPSVGNIYSTNWDLCFKTWVDYINISISDGTSIDKQSFPVFDTAKIGRGGGQFNYVPLHGSLDLVEISRPKGSGIYRDIQKISDPLGYFKEKPNNIENIFMIYPLEAVGYEESVKSPYLDLLSHFKSSLQEEQECVFVIGYSLRDPTIGSIFEEVIAERIRKGDLNLLSKDLDSRKEDVKNHKLKIVVVNPSPEKLAENLKRQHHTNLLQTFVPIKIRFPKITDPDFHNRYTQALRQLGADLEAIGYISSNHRNVIVDTLRAKYGFKATELDWGPIET